MIHPMYSDESEQPMSIEASRGQSMTESFDLAKAKEITKEHGRLLKAIEEEPDEIYPSVQLCHFEEANSRNVLILLNKSLKEIERLKAENKQIDVLLRINQTLEALLTKAKEAMIDATSEAIYLACRGDCGRTICGKEEHRKDAIDQLKVKHPWMEEMT